MVPGFRLFVVRGVQVQVSFGLRVPGLGGYRDQDAVVKRKLVARTAVVQGFLRR